MIKKMFLTALLFLCFTTVFLFPQDNPVWWGSMYKPGNLGVSAALGFESDSGANSFVVYPEAEIIIFKPKFEQVAPFDIGFGARGRLGIGLGSNSGFAFGAGGVVTLHLGFRGIDFLSPRFISPLDVFSELGIGFNILKPASSNSLVSFISSSGIRYFITDAFAAYACYTSWGMSGGGTLGVTLKLGKKPVVAEHKFEETVAEIQKVSYYPYLMQFQWMYWYTFALGGWVFDDSSYSEGDGTVWRISSTQGDEDQFDVERSLLKVNPDGSKWWKARFILDKDEILYEFLIDADYNLLELKFRDSEGNIGSWDAEKDGTKGWVGAPADVLTYEEYEPWIVDTRDLTTPAGTFTVDYLKHDYADADYSYLYEWWVSDSVPGVMVKFHWENQEEKDEITGELIKILKNVKEEL